MHKKTHKKPVHKTHHVIHHVAPGKRKSACGIYPEHSTHKHDGVTCSRCKKAR